MRTRQMQQLLSPPPSLCLHRRPTSPHLLLGFSHCSHPAPPPLVLCPLCKLIPPAQPLSLPASLLPSPYTFSSRELWPAPAQLSPTQAAPRGPTHCCLSLLQNSSLRWGVTHGTLFLSPSNLSGCQTMMTLTWRRSCGSFILRGFLASLSWSLAAGGAWLETSEGV